MSTSAKYSKVKGYYDGGLWSLDHVKTAVQYGWITAEEYETITGETYSA